MLKLTKLFSLTDIIRLLPANQKLPEEDDVEDWIDEEQEEEIDDDEGEEEESNSSISRNPDSSRDDSWNIPNSEDDFQEYNDEENPYSLSNSSSLSSSFQDYPDGKSPTSFDGSTSWRRTRQQQLPRRSPTSTYGSDLSEDDQSSPIHVLTTKPRMVPNISGIPMSYDSTGTPIRSMSSAKIESSSVTEGVIRRDADFFGYGANSVSPGSVIIPPPSQSVGVTTPTTPIIVGPPSLNIKPGTGISISSNTSHIPQVTFNNSPRDPASLASPRDDELMDLPFVANDYSKSSSSLNMISGITSDFQMSRHNQALSYSLTQSHRIRGTVSSGIPFGEVRGQQPMTPMRNSYQQHFPRIQRRGEVSGSFSSDSDDSSGTDSGGGMLLHGRVKLGRGGMRRRSRPGTNFKVSVVGSDYENGVLYVAVMHMDKTYLNSFSVKTRQLTPLYTWNEPLDIVWVSLNSLLKVVGVTVVRHISKLYTNIAQPPSSTSTTAGTGAGANSASTGTASSSCYYETFIQCFDESKKHYIGEKTANAQKMQFISDKGAQGSSVSSSLTVESRFLHTISSHSVTLYTVTSLRKSPRTALYTITKPPNKALAVCNEFLWSKYSDTTKTFHCLFVVNDKKSGKGVRCSYKSVSFKTDNPKVYPDSVFSLCFTLTMHFNTFDECLPLPYVLRDSSRPDRRPVPRTPALPCITLVSLRSGVSCLCIQHEPAGNSVPVSVIVLGLKTRVDFVIPVSQTAMDMKSLRVFFASFHDYLFIYVPGVYLHLLDVSSTHNPGPGLIFSGRGEHTAPLPASSKGLFPAVGPLRLKGFHNRKMLVDTRTGDVLEYSVNSTGILRLVDEWFMDTPFLCKLLHAACMHFNDDVLVNDILVRMFKAHPRQTTVSLLKEYVLGETYFKLRAELPQEIIMGIPSTLSSQNRFFAKGLSDSGVLKDVSVVPMTSPRGRRAFDSIQPYSSTRLWWKSARDREAAHLHILAGSVASRRPGTPAPATAVPASQKYDELKLKSVSLIKKSPYLRLFRDSDGNSLDDTLAKTPAGVHIEDVIYEMTIGIIKYVFSQKNVKISPVSAQSYAEKAHEIQSCVIDVLFATIVSTFSEDEEDEETDSEKRGDAATTKKSSLKAKRAAHAKKMNMFVVLENLLNVIVELGGILYPNGFIKKFAYLGYQCLPEVVFLQYVEKGTIRVTKDFVWTLYMRGVHTKKPELFYRVVSKLPWYEMTEIILSQPPPPMYLVDHFLSNNYKDLVYGRIEISDNSSEFIPLTQMLKMLKLCSEERKLLVLPDSKKYSPETVEDQRKVKALLKVIEGLSFDYCIKFLDLDFSERTDDDDDKFDQI